MDSDVCNRMPVVCHQRRYPTFCRCAVRDDFRIYDNRCDSCIGCGRPDEGQLILAKLQPLDRGHGRSCISACHRADGGRQPHEPDEGGKPGTFGWKACAEGAPDSKISVYYLFCPDRDRGNFSTLWRNESV